MQVLWKDEQSYHADVSVDVEHAFVGTSILKLRQNQFLHSKHDPIAMAVNTQTHTLYKVLKTEMRISSTNT